MRDAAIIGSGAALGAVARFLLSVLFPAAGILLAINIAGSALMGYFQPSPFWGTGVLGGFTSFATFAFLASEMTPAAAGMYVASTLIGCVVAYLSGRAMGDRVGT